MRHRWIALAAVLVVGCGGDGAREAAVGGTLDASGTPDQGPGTGGSAAKAAQLDLAQNPMIDGYMRFEGGCGAGFPFHVQHPAGWSVTGSHLGFNKDRSDGVFFSIRVAEQFGGVHADNQRAMLKGTGAKTVGTVRIAGQPVEVLGRSGNDRAYVLYAPFPWGQTAVGYYALHVQSTLGDEATFEILQSLVPVAGC